MTQQAQADRKSYHPDEIAVSRTKGASRNNDSCRVFRLIFPALLALFALVFSPAAYGSSAELIIKHGDGRVIRKTVTFSEPSISGTELLRRSGLDVSIVDGSAGEAVYMIDGEGDPAGWVTKDGKTYYWNYFRYQNGKWIYSTTGAGASKVADGDKEGWLWQESGGKGTLPSVSEGKTKAGSAESAKSLESAESAGKAGDKGSSSSYLGFLIIAAGLAAAAVFFASGRAKQLP